MSRTTAAEANVAPSTRDKIAASAMGDASRRFFACKRVSFRLQTKTPAGSQRPTYADGRFFPPVPAQATTWQESARQNPAFARI
jgi:hypothetical protein